MTILVAQVADSSMMSSIVATYFWFAGPGRATFAGEHGQLAAVGKTPYFRCRMQVEVRMDVIDTPTITVPHLDPASVLRAKIYDLDIHPEVDEGQRSPIWTGSSPRASPSP